MKRSDVFGLRMELGGGVETCKHLDEISIQDREEAKILANEIKELLETYLLLPAEEAKPFIDRATKFQLELEQMGFGVIVSIFLSAETLKLTADVGLLTSHVKSKMVN